MFTADATRPVLRACNGRTCNQIAQVRCPRNTIRRNREIHAVSRQFADVIGLHSFPVRRRHTPWPVLVGKTSACYRVTGRDPAIAEVFTVCGPSVAFPKHGLVPAYGLTMPRLKAKFYLRVGNRSTTRRLCVPFSLLPSTPIFPKTA